jgi:hypothetical protein
MHFKRIVRLTHNYRRPALKDVILPTSKIKLGKETVRVN